MATTPTRSLATSAVMRKLRATPSTSSTRRVSKRRCEGALTVHTPFIGPSMRGVWRLFCAGCSTGAPESSAKMAAFGRWRWLPRRVSRKVLPKSGCLGKRSGLPWPGWGCAGKEPSTGSLLPTRYTREKKKARWTDAAGKGEGRLGCGLLGRVLVEQGGATEPAQL